jgi:hypothetical protein
MAAQALNDFAIRTFEFPYAIAETSERGVARQADFVIDGTPIGKTLNLWPDRPWFGRTRFEQPRRAVATYVEELLGLRIPHHGGGIGRVVLFGCHCGMDACGLITAVVRREGGVMRWENIAWENDDDVEHTRYGKVGSLTFDYAQYLEAVNAYAARLIEPKRLPDLAGHSWASVA